MTTQTEAQLEAALVARLQGKGWEPVTLATEAELWANLRLQLGLQNAIDFTDAEFARVRNHLEKGNIFDKAHTLRGRFHLTRDDGIGVYIQFFNSDHWCRNRYQVATQIGIKGRRKNRYDVTLLVNGLPLCQIELKRRGVELKAAFDQINRYQRDSFEAAGGLFMFVQIFVISNGVNTRYYANNRYQSFAQTFAWADTDNKPINRLEAFADIFLEKCQLSKMIAKYVVMHESFEILMVLRSYQYYAAERILERVQLHQGNGYVWHTTGSGKTLTSFKAAQNLLDLPKVDRVIFVVDRADLDYQTTKEFNHFEPGSVDGTENTKQLVAQLTKPDARLVITTIQKLNAAISREQFGAAMQGIKDARVVFIFDECHRSQFGETHRRIREFFTRAQLFGFTGTPIFDKNAIGYRTTKSLFDEQLHSYVITDAIRDANVLRFSVEYIGTQQPAPVPTGDKKEDRKNKKLAERLYASRDYLEHPDRIEAVTDWVIENHPKKTRGRQFGAIMAVGSVDGLIQYFEAFERKRQEGLHDLRIATIFTYAANEDDPDADGLLPDTNFPDGPVTAAQAPKRDKLAEFVTIYNATFGENQSINDGKSFYAYYKALAQRMKLRDTKGFVPEKGIDILLVVNMFLTGFDAKTVNTLYVDKNLRYHGLIQAFSRTNRILNQEKSQGNIVCFRDLKEATDEAIALFADKNARETILVGTYDEHLDKLTAAVERLLAIVPNADAVDDLTDEDAQAEFAKAFREIMRLRNVLASFAEYDPADLPMDEQDFEDFKGKYLDLSQKSGQDETDPGAPLAGLDFELELLRRDEINVAYILALLLSLNSAVHEGGATSRKAKDKRKQIFDLLMSEVQLRNKRDLITGFIDQRMPMLGPDDDVREAFHSFWGEEREKAFQQLVESENLDAGGVQRLFAQIVFSGKQPMQDDLIAVMKVTPGVLNRKSAADRVLAKILSIIETFDDGLGNIQE